jgi:phosphatidate phosphatase APP1
MGLKQRAGHVYSAVEGFFDRLKLGYKWRTGRWKPITILCYRGYGTRQRLMLRGRILEDRGVTELDPGASRWRHARNMLDRIGSDEIPGARLAVRFGDQEFEATTGNEGHFVLDIAPDEPLDHEREIHEIELELLAPRAREQGAVRAVGEVRVPPRSARLAVVSDIDDTIVPTQATDTLRMLKIVMTRSAARRPPFEGVAAFYEALRDGPDGDARNPLFYVSSSPWNFYDLFDRLMDLHGVPPGPILLKDFGFAEDKFLKKGHEGYKIGRVTRLLELYPDLPFVLVGDSGQRDPEVYHHIAERYPDRIRAIYIREIEPGNRTARDRGVRDLARETEAFGVPMRLVADTLAAAEHAAELGLIGEAALARVAQAVERDRSSSA